jgi:hypothetical protein
LKNKKGFIITLHSSGITCEDAEINGKIFRSSDEHTYFAQPKELVFVKYKKELHSSLIVSKQGDVITLKDLLKLVNAERKQ